MSKDQIKTVYLSVENVENLRFLLSWIPTTLIFWKIDNIFPCNLIIDCCNESLDKLNNDIQKNIK